ncbi:hypothetical protein C3469_15820 [Mycobacterium kansasii]|uniref:hypothetical protein n=1 Tax=Mycobacterium kansasii TaxID=1768 RepID=UPI000CDE4315|nr:hypothetical protein [Mycobacterium kansasii]POX99463.1 hypothetical protein C3479_18965 [Mycobacterium kansasii]POY26363.1 hypothetical protein C3469_15820 [Mycobacterium kansasii]
MSVNVRTGDVDQLMMLPPSVREWLREDHLAFFVLDVVAELERQLDAANAQYTPANDAKRADIHTGHNPHHNNHLHPAPDHNRARPQAQVLPTRPRKLVRK